MVEEGYGNEFGNILLKTMQNLSREIKEMRVKRRRETPTGLPNGETSGTSHYLYEKPTTQKASQFSTMLTILAIGNGARGPQEQEALSDYFLEYESQSQRFKEHLTFQEFFQIKENRRPRSYNRGRGCKQGNDLQHTIGKNFLPTFDGSSKSTKNTWEETTKHTLVDETPPNVEVSIDGVSGAVTKFSDDSSASQVNEVSEDNSTIIEEPLATQASGFME